MNIKSSIIPLTAVITISALLYSSPIAQNLSYHNFADQRDLWQLPNLLNVVTNLPFALIGFMGIGVCRNEKDKRLRVISLTLFFSFLLLTFGSGYYHLYPNNKTLVYDRIPIVVILMSFTSLMVFDRINKVRGYRHFFIFNIVGIMSVVYWGLTEELGEGDLRWYAFVQFFPVIAIPMLMYLYKSQVDYKKEVLLMFIFFGIAKLCESLDVLIYQLLSNTISGHSLKHLFMAAAGYEIVLLLQKMHSFKREVVSK